MAERIGSVGLQRLEPHIAGLDALSIPSTGIVDYMAVASAMAKIIRAAGAELQFGIEILAIRERPDAVEIASAQRSWRARTLIACGGLQSDRLAKMAGLKINHRIVPFRGEFYVLPKSRQGLISRLIYPIPDPRLPVRGNSSHQDDQWEYPGWPKCGAGVFPRGLSEIYFQTAGRRRLCDVPRLLAHDRKPFRIGHR